MALLVVLLMAFPGERIGTLPTGRILEPGIWQVSVSHRFLPDADNATLGTPWNFLRGANVRLAVERGINGRFNAGVYLNSAGDVKEAGLAGSWMPFRWLTAMTTVGTDVVELAPSGTWLSAGAAVFTNPTLGPIHLVVLPRVTANTAAGESNRLYVSLGAGAKVDPGAGFSFGAETEPVLYGQKDTARLLAWSIALDKEVGWHNFTLTVGNAWHQSVPGWFASANRDITGGNFRVGFNILRKL
ncbi:MAG: hypothetical protein JSU73_07505 [candidate division WOR-3 bacterium]|nr:MAG: hypothetical protein JSU73_07505 [candidate division WOR-3 bacterium]